MPDIISPPDRPSGAIVERRETAAYIDGMLTTAAALKRMSNCELLSAATRLAAEGREATADLVGLLVVLDERKEVYADEGYSSLFRFCVGRLRLSEEQAYYRIAAARVAARFPVVLERLRTGVLTLTAVAVLRKHLTEENHARLLRAAEGRSKHEVQQLVAVVAPRPDVPSSLRRLPPPRVVTSADGRAPGPSKLARPVPATPQCSVSPTPERVTPWMASTPLLPVPDAPLPLPTPPARRPEIRPLAPARYSLHVTISETTYGRLQQAKDLLRHKLPNGDPAAVIDLALTLLVSHLQRVKFGAKRSPEPRRPAAAKGRRRESLEQALLATPAEPTPGPPRIEPPPAPVAPDSSSAQSPASSTRSRYIPAAVRRRVWRRDAGACTFMAANGQRCGETGGLQFHHKVPFAEGGEPTVSNLELRCALHNQWDARRWFGDEVTTYRARQKSGRATASRNLVQTKKRPAGIPSGPPE